jgi:hypothetical protein
MISSNDVEQKIKDVTTVKEVVVERKKQEWFVRHGIYGKTKNYINNIIHKVKLYKSYLNNKYDLSSKISESLKYVFNVLFTGLIIWYIVNNKNILSYGLFTALFVYYFKFVVETIKKPVK